MSVTQGTTLDSRLFLPKFQISTLDLPDTDVTLTSTDILRYLLVITPSVPRIITMPEALEFTKNYLISHPSPAESFKFIIMNLGIATITLTVPSGNTTQGNMTIPAGQNRQASITLNIIEPASYILTDLGSTSQDPSLFGDVTGPDGGTVAETIVVFADTTGKLIKATGASPPPLFALSTEPSNNVLGSAITFDTRVSLETIAKRITCFGDTPLVSLLAGVRLVIMGSGCAPVLTVGSRNVLIGTEICPTLVTGNENTVLGDSADVAGANTSNTIGIGAGVVGTSRPITDEIVFDSDPAHTNVQGLIIPRLSSSAGPFGTGTLRYDNTSGSVEEVTGSAGLGNVTGPMSSTDNAVARYNETSGTIIQDSGVIVDDSDNVTGVVDLTATGTPTLGGNIYPVVTGVSGQVLTTNGSGTLSFTTVAGTGDVTGPGGSTDDNVTLFSGGSGKIIKDSGLSVPGSAFVGISDTQTLTNKIGTATTNAFRGTVLGTSGANVDVVAAAPPTTGQVLKATSATTAAWQADAGATPALSAVLVEGNTTGGTDIDITSGDVITFLKGTDVNLDVITQTTGVGTAEIPDLAGATDQFVLEDVTQTLINKTGTATTNAFRGTVLGTSGANVNVVAAAPPSIGQVLTATAATTATWQTPSSSGDLATVLTAGNTTGGTDIDITSGDVITFLRGTDVNLDVVTQTTGVGTAQIPDLGGATDQFVMEDVTQTVTNKIGTATTNAFRATELGTTGANVVIGAAAAPGGSGESLITTSATTATWQTTLGLRTMWIAAASMVSAVVDGAASAQIATATNAVNFKVFDFDDTTEEFTHIDVAFPKSWDKGTVTYQVFWSPAVSDAMANTVAFGLEGVFVSDDVLLDTAYGTSVVVEDDGPLSTDLYVSPVSAAVTIAGTPADDGVVNFRFSRDTGDMDDDLVGDARVRGIKIFYTVDAASDD